MDTQAGDAEAGAEIGDFHFPRQRLSRLLARAAKSRLVVVCAGSGYGKSAAVRDFVRESGIRTVWVTLERDDASGDRFWKAFSRAVGRRNAPLAKALDRLGFPDSVDRINRYLSLVRGIVQLKRRLIVVDNCHFVRDSRLIRFAERAMGSLPVGTSVILISRSAPTMNTADLLCDGRLATIGEEDLRFTGDELSGYFDRLGIRAELEETDGIFADSGGWPFALNFVARSYGRVPGYGGYLRTALRTNVFRLMETEVWEPISEELRTFLLRVSLLGHFSAELISLLAGEGSTLPGELEALNAYVRLDDYLGSFLIHPLFLEFLREKRGMLAEGPERETYAIAAGWCERHGFKRDALSYHEKTGDYAAIVALFYALPVQIPADIARHTADILDRAPQSAFDTVEFLAAIHLRSYICLGLLPEAAELALRHERRLLAPPDGGPVLLLTLARLYYGWSFLRALMCTRDHRYDIDRYFRKYRDSMERYGTEDVLIFPVYNSGAWLNLAGSEEKGSVDGYAESFARVPCVRDRFREAEAELLRAELKFFRGDLKAAGLLTESALALARKHEQAGIETMALFYTARLAVAAGGYRKAEDAIGEIEEGNGGTGGIVAAWYHCALGLPELVPAWLRRGFSPYVHPCFIENFANQVMARFCYVSGDFPPLLSYMAEVREREACLFGRVEMLAMEACVLHRMREPGRAAAVLHEAFLAASPNDIVMPFVELGKDVRALTSRAMRDPSCRIPGKWLETVNRRSALYAKHRSHVVSLYRDERDLNSGVVLSRREGEILDDLSHGLSRAEIAAGRNLSVNTVKMVVGRIHDKLGTGNLADLIRVAVELKLIGECRFGGNLRANMPAGASGALRGSAPLGG
ncbi:MAG: LuxR C-terminal-related transcriptional regulator [Treponema sp.]|nr:LuxR C-terminal-related transcriptional regulator [Treponema sp.]